MKDRARLVMSIIFLSPFIALSVTALQGVVRAETEPTDQQVPTEEMKAAKEKRIAERKVKYKDRYTKTQLQRTQARCAAAQQKVGTIKTRIVAVEKTRSERYATLVERLESAGQKLKVYGMDTIQYDSYVNELKTKVATVQQAFTEYNTALGDASEIECSGNAESFLASLEEARTIQQLLRKQSSEIRLYLNQTIKPALSTMQQNLQSEAGSDKL